MAVTKKASYNAMSISELSKALTFHTQEISKILEALKGADVAKEEALKTLASLGGLSSSNSKSNNYWGGSVSAYEPDVQRQTNVPTFTPPPISSGSYNSDNVADLDTHVTLMEPEGFDLFPNLESVQARIQELS